VNAYLKFNSILVWTIIHVSEVCFNIKTSGAGQPNKNLRTLVMEYNSHYWNIFDLIRIKFMMGFVLTAGENTTVYTWLTVVSWCCSFKFLRAFKSLRIFVFLLYESLKASKDFMVVMLLMLFTFTAAFSA
jgi:hypothetical protein